LGPLDGRLQNYWTKKIGAKDAKAERDKIDKFFSEMINQYDISYIELDRDIEVAKVCDIFTRLNSTGMELTIFDLMNAMLSQKIFILKRCGERFLSISMWLMRGN
jgi:hypothetical protein